MKRTQVQLTEEQHEALREISAATGRSLADLIREGLDQFLQVHSIKSRSGRLERARRAAGRFSSGSADGSSEHDRHLAEAAQE